MAQFRAAQWNDAVKTFSELRAISGAYPEVDALIADALLKAEVDRAKSPDSVVPPKHRKLLRPRLLTAVCHTRADADSDLGDLVADACADQYAAAY
jgi:hypothetical protein